MRRIHWHSPCHHACLPERVRADSLLTHGHRSAPKLVSGHGREAIADAAVAEGFVHVREPVSQRRKSLVEAPELTDAHRRVAPSPATVPGMEPISRPDGQPTDPSPAAKSDAKTEAPAAAS